MSPHASIMSTSSKDKLFTFHNRTPPLVLGHWVVGCLSHFGSSICVRLIAKFLACAMVAFARLEWLAHQIHSGRPASVRFSFNPVTATEKIQFALDAWDGRQCAAYRPGLTAALYAVDCAFREAIVTDKGHTSSTGQSIVQFWVKLPTNQVVSSDFDRKRAMDTEVLHDGGHGDNPLVVPPAATTPMEQVIAMRHFEEAEETKQSGYDAPALDRPGSLSSAPPEVPIVNLSAEEARLATLDRIADTLPWDSKDFVMKQLISRPDLAMGIMCNAGSSVTNDIDVVRLAAEHDPNTVGLASPQCIGMLLDEAMANGNTEQALFLANLFPDTPRSG